jgi:putative membrane protein
VAIIPGKSRFKQVLVIGLVLLIAVACLLFVLENQQLVAVSFLGFSTPLLQVSILGVVSFLLGMIVGGLMVSAIALRFSRKKRLQSAH